MTPSKTIPTPQRSPSHAAEKKFNLLRRIGLALSASAALLLVLAHDAPAALQPADKSDRARAEAKTHQLADVVELMQQDIVAELTGMKEKQLFQKADQLLHDVSRMETLLQAKSAATRAEQYKQFDRIDARATALREAAPQLAPKHPLIQRGCDRIRALTDDLHYALSQGDHSSARVRQVLRRQAKALADASRNLTRTADYALGDTPGRAELVAGISKLAAESGKFGTVADSKADLEQCRAQFKTLTQAWRQVVEGISLLPPAENVFLIRSAIRADGIHERLFRTLGLTGERPFITLRI